jgi:hypothetical protein
MTGYIISKQHEGDGVSAFRFGAVPALDTPVCTKLLSKIQVPGLRYNRMSTLLYIILI